MKKIKQLVTTFLASDVFFSITLVWFTIQSGWIALSGRYPMAYDERFHYQVMQIYAHRLHPFWSGINGDAPYGALSRDPSYLYHYVMSWPLRLLNLVTKDEHSQIVILRFTSIAFFLTGIWVFRKVLSRAGCSKSLANVVLAVFAATPLVSLLASQVNYDNGLFLVLALTLLACQNVMTDIKRNRLKAKNLVILACLGMIGALVKYAFLPVILALGITLGFRLLRGTEHTIASRWQEVWQGINGWTTKTKVVILVPFIVLFGLCFERYGVNVIRYHTPTPECDQVLTVNQCFANGPWRRNYQTRKSKLAGQLKPRNTNFIHFAERDWLSKTTYQLFYTLDGEHSNYAMGTAYRVPRVSSVVIFLVGIALYILYYRRLTKRYNFNFMFGVVLLYLGTLLIQNYLDLLHLGYPFGIQGRYLILVLPIIYAAVAAAFAEAIKWQAVRSVLAVLALVTIITQGGGAGTYILKSHDDWYWPNKHVIDANHWAQGVLRPFIIGQ